MKKRFLCLLLCIGAALCAAACRPNRDKISCSFEAMDTFMSFDLYNADTRTATELQETVEQMDKALNVTEADDPHNEIYRLNRHGSLTVSPFVAELTRQALALCAETQGALDVTVLPLMEEWGFLSGNYQVPGKDRIDALLRQVDYTKVRVEENTISLPDGMRLDFGAVAKGYAADTAFSILKQQKNVRAILNLGGTIAACGEKAENRPWRVGIADPHNSAAYMGYLDCRDKIIATSGSYERSFTGADGKIYSHIINPATGYPVDNGILSVTIVSGSGTRSDALSTALFVMGKEGALAFYQAHRDFDFIILTADQKAYVTKTIAGGFTLADGYEYQIITVD